MLQKSFKINNNQETIQRVVTMKSFINAANTNQKVRLEFINEYKDQVFNFVEK